MKLINSMNKWVLLCIIFHPVAAFTQPSVTNVAYSPDSNILFITFSEPIQTANIDLGRVYLSDGNEQIALLGADIVNEEVLTSELSVSLLQEGIIDSTTYGMNELFYLWGMNTTLVRNVELLDLSDLSVVADDGAFYNSNDEPSLYQLISCEVAAATDITEVLFATYDKGTNVLSLSFSQAVQFDELAEDRVNQNGEGNGQLDGNPSEDRNENGVLDREPNIIPERIGFQDSAGNEIWLEGYGEIFQISDSDQIDIRLTLSDSRRLETDLIPGAVSIMVLPYAFLNTNYNPNSESYVLMQIIEDDQPLIAESASYQPSLNELQIFFPGSREITVTDPSPVYSNIRMSNGIDETTLSGAGMSVANGSIFSISELTFSDQAAVEELILNMPTENTLTLSVEPYSIYDVNENGNQEIIDLPIDIQQEFDNPVLDDVVYDAASNRLTLNWSPDRVKYYHNNLLLTEPVNYAIDGVLIENTSTNEIYPLVSAEISRAYYWEKTYLDLTDEDDLYIELMVNSGNDLYITLDAYTFYSTGNTNNNGNLFESLPIDYIADNTGPTVLAVRVDETSRQLTFIFDENILTDQVNMNAADLMINGNQYTLNGLEIVEATPEYTTELNMLIPEDEYLSFETALPSETILDIEITIPENSFINIEMETGEPFEDINGNGNWDNEPEPWEDYGSDGIPSSEEPGYDPGSCSISGECTDPEYTTPDACESAGTCSDGQYNNLTDCESEGVCTRPIYHTEEDCESNGFIWTWNTWSWESWIDFNTQTLCVTGGGVWSENMDPAGDDYDPLYNPGGTEGNGMRDPGEMFTDLNENGLWDLFEPFVDENNNGVIDFVDMNGDGIYTAYHGNTVQTLNLSLGKYLWNKNFRSFPEDPSQMFCIRKLTGNDLLIYVEENEWNVHVTPGDVTGISTFFTTNKSTMETDFGSFQDVDGNGRLTLVLYDIPDEFGTGMNDTNSSLFIHGYFSLNQSGSEMTNMGDYLFLDVSPQVLEGGPFLGSMKHALVHEYTKLLIEQNDPDEEIWLREGLAFMAQKRILNDVKFFGENQIPKGVPGNQLTYIGYSMKNRYDQFNVYLFLSYLSEKYSLTDGWDIIGSIVQNHTLSGISSIDSALLNLGYTETTADIFIDYATACLLDIPQVYGYYDNRFILEAAELNEHLSLKNVYILQFTDNMPPPYGKSDIHPWSYNYYMAGGLLVNPLGDLIIYSPLLAPTDTLLFSGYNNVRYRVNKIMLRNGYYETIDPMYEVVEMNVDPYLSMGEIPVTTNSVIVDGDTINFTFKDYWESCSNQVYDNQPDCENSGNTWTLEGNKNLVLVIAKTDQDNTMDTPEYVISNAHISGQAPVNLQSTPLSDAVHLWWLPPPPMGSANLQSYQVLRKSSMDGVFQPIADNIIDLFYDDTTALQGETYIYAVAAQYDDGSFSDPSNEVEGWLLSETTVGFRTAITNIGGIGDPNASSTGRPSGEYPYGSGNLYLYDAGLWIGAMRYDIPKVTTYYYNPDNEWRPCMTSGSVRPEKTFYILDENNPVQEVCFDDFDPYPQSEHAPLGLKVLSRYALSPPVPGLETNQLETAPWAKITYSIINSGMSGDLDELFVGLWMDFDVSSGDSNDPHIDDLVDYDADLRLSFMYDGDNPNSSEDDTGENGLSSGYVGLALLRSPNNTVASHAWWNWDNDPGTDFERYAFINATHPAMEGFQYYPNPIELGYPPFDYRFLQSTGPFSLASYDTLTVEYLLVFGDDYDDLRQNVMRALLSESQPLTGDLNFDFAVDILDIMVLVNIILDTQPAMPEADLNADGQIDILDIITLINMIIDDTYSRELPVSDVNLEIRDQRVSITTDGAVAGIQFNVDGEFDITQNYLPEGWELRYSNDIILMFNTGPNSLQSSILFEYEGSLSVESIIVAGWDGSKITADCNCMIPLKHTLYPAYPNPFNSVTKISYDLPDESMVKIMVYDLQGREITQLVNEVQSSGYHTILWNAANVSSGIYFIRMISADFTKVQKVILLK